jgi:hypothetical protein
MLAVMRDPKADEEVRHRLALKAGACATDEEVEALIADHDKAPDDAARLLWAAAVFASHSRKAVPLLVRYAKQSPEEATRRGARVLLADLVGEGPAAALLEDKKDAAK